MLTAESLSTILLALATGFPDRAANVVAMTDELDDDARRVLLTALAGSDDPSRQAQRLGDALRSLRADRPLVNECYRVAFYAGPGWKALATNPLYAYFTANRAGDALDKWVHYFAIYERHLARYRERPVRVLEIGVYRGGGLELLRHYLGPAAHLVGIDIEEAARVAVRGRHPVEIGDQEDPDFLRRVAQQHGPFDVVIDDGGHRMSQQIVSVETLFPLLADGGTYLVEDTHTSYWSEYGAVAGEGATFIDWVKARIDDLHAYHHSVAADLDAPWQTQLAALHVYDSVVVLEKLDRPAPFSELTGDKLFITQGRDSSAIHQELLATRDVALAQLKATEARTADAAEEVRVLRGELLEAKQGAAHLQDDLGTAREELEQTRSDLMGSWGIIQEMRRSRSWRLTDPLRRLKSLVARK